MTSTRKSPLWLVIVAAAVPTFMATLDNLVVTNALPVIAKDLGALTIAAVISRPGLMLFPTPSSDSPGRVAACRDLPRCNPGHDPGRVAACRDPLHDRQCPGMRPGRVRRRYP